MNFTSQEMTSVPHAFPVEIDQMDLFVICFRLNSVINDRFFFFCFLLCFKTCFFLGGGGVLWGSAHDGYGSSVDVDQIMSAVFIDSKQQTGHVSPGMHLFLERCGSVGEDFGSMYRQRVPALAIFPNVSGRNKKNKSRKGTRIHLHEMILRPT